MYLRTLPSFHLITFRVNKLTENNHLMMVCCGLTRHRERLIRFSRSDLIERTLPFEINVHICCFYLLFVFKPDEWLEFVIEFRVDEMFHRESL